MGALAFSERVTVGDETSAGSRPRMRTATAWTRSCGWPRRATRGVALRGSLPYANGAMARADAARVGDALRLAASDEAVVEAVRAASPD
jgi:hypothetical protein